MTERAPALTHLPASSGPWPAGCAAPTRAPPPRPARLVPGRVHLPLQPPRLDPPRPALLPPPGGGGGDAAPALPPGRRRPEPPRACPAGAAPIPSAPLEVERTDSLAKHLTTRGKGANIRLIRTFVRLGCATFTRRGSRGQDRRAQPGRVDGRRHPHPGGRSARPWPGALPHPALPLSGGGVRPPGHRGGGQPGAPAPPATPTPGTTSASRSTSRARGVLNAYARTAVRATAWLAKSSIERQRDVLRSACSTSWSAPGRPSRWATGGPATAPCSRRPPRRPCSA
jgi:hypothetical protein